VDGAALIGPLTKAMVRHGNAIGRDGRRLLKRAQDFTPNVAAH